MQVGAGHSAFELNYTLVRMGLLIQELVCSFLKYREVLTVWSYLEEQKISSGRIYQKYSASQLCLG
jgi:hypothetical protein